MTPTSELPKAAESALDPENFDQNVWERLKQFTEFGVEDIERLKALGSQVQRHLPAVVDRFYDHLLEFAETRKILETHDVKSRLKESQRAYLQTLFSGEYGEDYLRDRMQVGLAHERVGLGLRWYLGGYWLYLRELVPILLEDTDPQVVERLMSFLKALILDMQLITETYVGRTMSLVRSQRDRLEQMVEERTRKLNQWERLAAVGSMSAKVAHEIRNPLSSISLNTELLSDELSEYEGVDISESQNLLDSISGELDRLSRIVDEYLQFARMPRLEIEPVDLAELVRDVGKFLEGEFVQQGVTFVCDARDLPPLALDRNQFRQVLLNLFRNAQEAMPAGGTLKVDLYQRPDGKVLLRVVDTGVGLDPDQKEQLFDPFYTTKDSGTGLGLPYIQQVIQELRGGISVNGEPGRGATVDILLPDDLVMSDAVASSRARAAAARRKAPPGARVDGRGEG